MFHLPFYLHAIASVLSRGLIIMASVIMFPENRFYTHITVTSMSLFIALVCTFIGRKDGKFTGAYMDSETNMVAIVFCIVDILGVASAWMSSDAFQKQGGTPSPVIQVTFIIFLLAVLVLIVTLTLKATYERIQIARHASKTSILSMWKAYTKCEAMFLFPILLVVSIVLGLGRCFWCLTCCCRKSKRSNNTSVRVVPA